MTRVPLACRAMLRRHLLLAAPALAADIGVSPAIALRSLETDRSIPVPIDARVIADQQRTADRYTAARVIPDRQDAAAAFDASFNGALG